MKSFEFLEYTIPPNQKHPEHFLLEAVYENAIMDIVRNKRKILKMKSGKTRLKYLDKKREIERCEHEIERAMGWFYSQHDNYIMSFVWICNQLNWNCEMIRNPKNFVKLIDYYMKEKEEHEA